jgi:hypothetical protein
MSRRVRPSRGCRGPNTQKALERLARQAPTTLACMHGSAWRGDGAGLLMALAQAVN